MERKYELPTNRCATVGRTERSRRMKKLNETLKLYVVKSLETRVEAETGCKRSCKLIGENSGAKTTTSGKIVDQTDQSNPGFLKNGVDCFNRSF